MDTDRPRSPFSTSTASSASFDPLGDDLISSIDEDFQCNTTWTNFPFIQQKVVGVRVEITSISHRNQAITYKSVIAGYIDRPGPGLELANLEKDSKMFTSSGLYVLYCHITDLKLLDNINPNYVDVLRKLHPLKYVTLHKAAYDHNYMIETFGHNQPNPILQYDNNPVPMTEDDKINMPYLKTLFALQPQKYRINTWLHKTGVYKYATEHNLSQGVSDSLRTGDITGYDSKEKFHDMWFNTFREHSLSFSHWFEMYQLERANQIELAEMINTYQIEQDSEDWNDIPTAHQQPTSSSPEHQSAKVLSFGAKQINFVDRIELTNTEQK
jgi:hypothetical protein